MPGTVTVGPPSERAALDGCERGLYTAWLRNEPRSRIVLRAPGC